MAIESKAKGEVALTGFNLVGDYYSKRRKIPFSELKEFVTEAEVAGTQDSDYVLFDGEVKKMHVEPEAELVYMPSRQQAAVTDALAVLWNEFKPLGLPILYVILLGIAFFAGALIF